MFLHLRHRGRHYRKRGAAKDSRGIIRNRVDIEKRPEIVEKRTRFGDLEVDFGKEFAGHQEVSEQLGIQYYFAKPYQAWQRGSNENLNGLIRQYFKKSTDFHQITDQQIKYVEDKLNNRPRKRFNYENPTFVMNQFLFNPKVAFVT